MRQWNDMSGTPRAWGETWEPYRPRRLPWRELPQLIAGAAFLAVAFVAIQL